MNNLLFLCSPDVIHSSSFLFHCAKFWAAQGDRVLFISQSPVNKLPPAIAADDGVSNMETFNQIRFLYLSSWEDLIKHLYSVHLQPHPPTVMIIHHLEHYCDDSDKDGSYDHCSLTCASLLFAAGICASRLTKPSYLICDYHLEDLSVPKTIVKNFFNIVWHMQKLENNKGKQLISLTKFSQKKDAGARPAKFVFSVDCDDSVLILQELFKRSE